MEFLIIGLAVAFNCIIIKEKFQRGRTEDGIFDLSLLVLITLVFSGTYGALVVGTIASAFISIYFMASPPTFFTNSVISMRLKEKLKAKQERKSKLERML